MEAPLTGLEPELSGIRSLVPRVKRSGSWGLAKGGTTNCALRGWRFRTFASFRSFPSDSACYRHTYGRAASANAMGAKALGVAHRRDRKHPERLPVLMAICFPTTPAPTRAQLGAPLRARSCRCPRSLPDEEGGCVCGFWLESVIDRTWREQALRMAATAAVERLAAV
jgi:hypothetical protein